MSSSVLALETISFPNTIKFLIGDSNTLENINANTEHAYPYICIFIAQMDHAASKIDAFERFLARMGRYRSRDNSYIMSKDEVIDFFIMCGANIEENVKMSNTTIESSKIDEILKSLEEKEKAISELIDSAQKKIEQSIAKFEQIHRTDQNDKGKASYIESNVVSDVSSNAASDETNYLEVVSNGEDCVLKESSWGIE